MSCVVAILDALGRDQLLAGGGEAQALGQAVEQAPPAKTGLDRATKTFRRSTKTEITGIKLWRYAAHDIELDVDDPRTVEPKPA